MAKEIVDGLIAGQRVDLKDWSKATFYTRDLADHMEERNPGKKLDYLGRLALRDIVYVDKYVEVK